MCKDISQEETTAVEKKAERNSTVKLWQCRYCRRIEDETYLRRKTRNRPRKKRVITPRKVQKRHKTHRLHQIRAARKNTVAKKHVSTQSNPSPPKAQSPLCVGHGHLRRNKLDQDLIEHSEITPEIIHQTLKQLSLWRKSVELERIFKYILHHYPVNRNKKRLKAELIQKLQIAQLTGMVCQDSNGRWRLCDSMEGLRQTPKAVVSLFWEIYCNTMDPLEIQPRKTIPIFKPDREDKDSDSDSLPEVNSDIMV